MALTLAHLSEVHLGPLPPGAAWENFALKRIVGTLSWKLKRCKLHDPAISSALVADIKAAAPDHVAFTGDLLNVSAYAEFPRAARWLQGFGDPTWISYVPGNHDAYVPVPWKQGLAYLASVQEADGRFPGEESGQPAITSLAVMAFLSRGHMPDEGRYGKQISQAIDFVLSTQKRRGYFSLLPVAPPASHLSLRRPRWKRRW